MTPSRRDLCLALPASLAVGVTAPQAHADDSNAEDATSPGPSRAELFETFVIPAGISDYDAALVSTKEMGIPPNFGFPIDAQFDRTTTPPAVRKDTLFGVDLSHYSGSISFNPLRAQGVFFVFMKASQGAAYVDDKFSRFWAAAGRPSGAAKVYRGAYHFLSHNVPGTDQAEHFARVLNRSGGLMTDDLPPVVDLEWDVAHKGAPDRWIGIGAEGILTILRDCLSALEKQFRRKPIIYTSNAWFSDETIPKNRFAEIGNYKLWLADYNPRRHPNERVNTLAGNPAMLWQFAENSSLSGYEGHIDTSVFHGSEELFRSSFGIA